MQATYGYNLDWVRQVTAGTLTGDIGLKVQIGLAANVGFHISGKHAVVLSRGTGDEENQLRFRLYRLKVRNWDVGFSAKAEAQAVDSLLPANFDDLIAGVFGVTGTKIVKALQDVDSWTKPGQPLFGPLTGVSAQYLADFFKSVTGVDINSEFGAIKANLQTLFSIWNALPQPTTKLIWSHLSNPPDIQSIVAIAGLLAAADRPVLPTVLAGLLKSAPFFSTPAGKWLESLTSESLFTACDPTALSPHRPLLSPQSTSRGRGRSGARLSKGARQIAATVVPDERDKSLQGLQRRALEHCTYSSHKDEAHLMVHQRL